MLLSGIAYSRGSAGLGFTSSRFGFYWQQSYLLHIYCYFNGGGFAIFGERESLAWQFYSVVAVGLFFSFILTSAFHFNAGTTALPER